MTPRLMLVTPEQVKLGWMELRGVTPIHHNFVVLAKRADGNYVVRAPGLIDDGLDDPR